MSLRLTAGPKKVNFSPREAPFSKILRRRVFSPWYLRAAQWEAEAKVAQATKTLHANNVAQATAVHASECDRPATVRAEPTDASGR